MIPRPPPAAPRAVVLLVPPRAQLVGLIGLLEAFDAANRYRLAAGHPEAYALTLAGVEPTARSGAGAVLSLGDVKAIEAAHTLVVGGATLDGAVDPRVVQGVERLGASADRVVSICAGAFALGELGWLDGRRCTTHWLALDTLRARYPAALVEPDALYTEDGRLYTSAGATAGVDLALHLIRQDLGPRLSRAVARALVVFAHRPGGQSQFSSALRLRPGLDATLQKLVDGVLAHPEQDHPVDALAARAGMSPRNFARVFRARTGETPAAFVARARVELAQRALAQSGDGLDAVAQRCGFGTAETMRRTFQRVAGVSPGAWRARFA